MASSFSNFPLLIIAPRSLSNQIMISLSYAKYILAISTFGSFSPVKALFFELIWSKSYHMKCYLKLLHLSLGRSLCQHIFYLLECSNHASQCSYSRLISTEQSSTVQFLISQCCSLSILNLCKQKIVNMKIILISIPRQANKSENFLFSSTISSKLHQYQIYTFDFTSPHQLLKISST